MARIDLTEGPVKGHLKRMTMPMIWGITAILSMNLADTYFVGQLGPDQLAAMGFTFPVVGMLSAFAFGIGAGASSVIARAIGAKDTDKVQMYTTQGLILALILALCFTATGIVFSREIFRLLGAPDNLLPLINDYMHIWFGGSFLIVVPMVGNAGIRAAGNSKIPGIVMTVVAVVNVILDPIFIFGLFGFPRMELQGAALATVLAYSITFLTALYILRYRLHMISFAACTRGVRQSWAAILRVGLPATGTNLIPPLSTAVTTRMIAGYGPDAVAGYGVASRIEALCIIPLMALCAILGPVVGQNWGANRKDRVVEALRASEGFSIICGIAAAAVLWLFADNLSHLFTDRETIIDAAHFYLVIIPVTYAFLGFVMIASASANGIGTPLPSVILSLSRLVVIYFPSAWGLSAMFGLNGIYMATALSNVVVGVGALLWSRRHYERAQIKLETGDKFS